MTYFYKFLNPVSTELAQITKELEGAIYQSPRAMLTHSRTFIEAVLEKVMIHENMINQPFLTIMERIETLNNSGLLPSEVKNSFHEIRKLGNVAAHDTRQFRFSESLTAWEHIYVVVKWFVEVYGAYEIEVPEYVDPIMKRDHSYGLEEMAIRFKQIEDLLKQSIEKEMPKDDLKKVKVQNTEDRKTNIDNDNLKKEKVDKATETAPGLVSIRKIFYESEAIDIPYFLRDVFLLPQRFEESERFLVRLGGEEHARIISELPDSLEGFHKRITRYNETHSYTFFNELKQFITEEIRRRKLIQNRPGELFLFHNSNEIVVTEDLGKIAINRENFTGMPGLINQLNEDGIQYVRDLPKELLIIGKYKGVGKSRVESFFNQLTKLQETKIKELV